MVEVEATIKDAKGRACAQEVRGETKIVEAPIVVVSADKLPLLPSIDLKRLE